MSWSLGGVTYLNARLCWLLAAYTANGSAVAPGDMPCLPRHIRTEKESRYKRSLFPSVTRCEGFRHTFSPTSIVGEFCSAQESSDRHAGRACPPGRAGGGRPSARYLDVVVRPLSPLASPVDIGDVVLRGVTARNPAGAWLSFFVGDQVTLGCSKSWLLSCVLDFPAGRGRPNGGRPPARIGGRGFLSSVSAYRRANS